MKNALTIALLVTALFAAGLVSANDPLISAFDHYADGVQDAALDYERCVLRNRTVDQQMVCALTFNSRMIMLSIEVELILAGYDREILNSISQ